MSVKVQIKLSTSANELISREVAKINKGKSARRGDKLMSKAKYAANIIDKYYKL